MASEDLRRQAAQELARRRAAQAELARRRAAKGEAGASTSATPTALVPAPSMGTAEAWGRTIGSGLLQQLYDEAVSGAVRAFYPRSTVEPNRPVPSRRELLQEQRTKLGQAREITGVPGTIAETVAASAPAIAVPALRGIGGALALGGLQGFGASEKEDAGGQLWDTLVGAGIGGAGQLVGARLLAGAPAGGLAQQAAGVAGRGAAGAALGGGLAGAQAGLTAPEGRRAEAALQALRDPTGYVIGGAAALGGALAQRRAALRGGPSPTSTAPPVVEPPPAVVNVGAVDELLSKVKADNVLSQTGGTAPGVAPKTPEVSQPLLRPAPPPEPVAAPVPLGPEASVSGTLVRPESVTGQTVSMGDAAVGDWWNVPPEQRAVLVDRYVERIKQQFEAEAAAQYAAEGNTANLKVPASLRATSDEPAVTLRAEMAPGAAGAPELAAAVDADIAARSTPRSVEVPSVPDVPLATPQLAAESALVLQEAVDWGQRMNKRDKGWFAKLSKTLLAPEFRAAEIVAPFIREMNAVPHIQNAQFQRVFRPLRQALANLTPEGQKQVETFFKQNVSPEDWKNAPRVPFEALPDAWKQLHREGLAQAAEQRDYLVEKGYFTPEQAAEIRTMDENGRVWMHRDYRAHLDNAYVPKARDFNYAVKRLVQDSKGKLSHREAVVELQALLGTYGKGGVDARWQASRLGKDILQNRGKAPAYLRKFMGEVHNPAFVTATSMSELEAMYRKAKVSEAAVSPELKGQVWDDRPSDNMFPKKVWIDGLDALENRRNFGELAGKYVAPELYETVMQSSQARVNNALQEVLMGLTSNFKFAKVGLNVVSWMRDFASNTFFAAGAGLPIWNPRWGPRMAQAVRSLKAYGDTFLTPKGAPGSGLAKDVRLVQWALEDGAIRPGTGAEFGGSVARSIARQYLRDKRPGIYGWLQATGDALQSGKAKLGELRDYTDNATRLAAYAENLDKFLTRQKLPEAKARALASMAVNNNFASSGSVSPAVRQFSQTYGAFLNPFMLWGVDNLRVTGKQLQSLRTAPAAVLRLGTQTALVAGLFEGLRRLYNFSDAEVQEAETRLRGGYKERNPFRQWLPLRDDSGRPWVVSLTAVHPWAGLGRGPEESPLARRVAENLAGTVYEGGLAADPINRVLVGAGLKAEMPFEPKTIPGKHPVAGILDTFYKTYEPGFVLSLRNAARKSQIVGQPGRFEEPMTPAQAFLSQVFPPTAAFSPAPVGPKSQAGRIAEQRSQKKELQSNVRALRRAPEPDQALIKAQQDRLKKLNQGGRK